MPNHTQGPHKETIHNYIIPPRKNYLCIPILLKAWGLVTGTAALPDEKCLLSKIEVYLLLSAVFSENCLWSDLYDFWPFYWDRTQRRGETLNVSLADLIRYCPFTQGHSGVFRFLIVSILRFVKTGTHSVIIPQDSVGFSAVKKAKRDGFLFKFFVKQFGNPASNTSKEREISD